MSRENGENANSKDKVKRFFDWVNADEDLPSPEELGYVEEEDTEEEHEEVPHEEPEISEREAAKKKADLDAITEDYEGDDEFEYPDEVAHENPLEEEAIIVGKKISAAEPKALHMTRRQKLQMERFRLFYLILSAVVAINVIAVLLITIHYLPPFGSPDNPAVNEVYARYIEQGTAETGALNIVAAVLFSYRSFDTLGEALMLFTAAIGVVILMRKPTAIDKAGKSEE